MRSVRYIFFDLLARFVFIVNDYITEYLLINISNICISFNNSTLFDTLSLFRNNFICTTIFCSDCLVSVITSIINCIDWSTSCILFRIFDDFSVFIFIMNGYISKYFVINIDNTSSAFNNLTAFLTLSCFRINAIDLTISCSNSSWFVICCIVVRTNFAIWRIYNTWCNSIALLILVIDNYVTIFFWCIWNKVIVVGNIGIAFDNFTFFCTLSSFWIKTIFLTVNCRYCFFPLIGCIVVCSHF